LGCGFYYSRVLMASWQNTGRLNLAVDQTSVIKLQNGKILKIGGNVPAQKTVECELYDPATGIWTVTGPMAHARSNAMAVLLADGTVLAFGGGTGGYSAGGSEATAEIYDPGAGTWSATGSMSVARVAGGFWHLADDTVLVAGGSSLFGPSLASAEIYDPNTGVWTLTGSLNTSRGFFGFALSGTTPVAVGGCTGSTGATILTSTETYNTGTGLWTVKSACTVPGTFNDGFNNCVTLNDATILLASGRTVNFGIGDETGNCAVYDVGSDTWTTVGSLNQKRDEGQLWKLADGTVLMGGGFTNNDTVFLSQCEIYDPIAQTWTISPAAFAEPKAAIFTDIGPLLDTTNEPILAGGFSGITVTFSDTTQILTSGAPTVGTSIGAIGSLGFPTSGIASVQAGSLIAVAIYSSHAGFPTVSGVSDGTNTYVQAAGAYVTSGTTKAADIWYAENVAAGSYSVTATGTGDFFGVAAVEIIGAKTSASLETTGSHQNLTGTNEGPSLTTADPGSFFFMSSVLEGAANTSASAPWVVPALPSSGGSNIVTYLASPGAAGAQQALFQPTSANNNSTAGAVFLSSTPPVDHKKQASMFQIF
jgi:hypothetical protein